MLMPSRHCNTDEHTGHVDRDEDHTREPERGDAEREGNDRKPEVADIAVHG